MEVMGQIILETAVAAVLNKETGLLKASKTLKIPHSTTSRLPSEING
jgi:hypothetical protein